MQISDILNQLNQQSMSTGSMTAASGATQEYSAGSQTLSELQEGEVFEGTVMDVENGKVTISLANGSSIQARLDSGVSLTQGMAYLTSWQGPVLEKDDPYGDGISPENLKAAKHVQNIELIEAENLNDIKEAVYKHGAVQTSLYCNVRDTSLYNRAYASYYYSGEQSVNHDVVIVGWDDTYPAERFSTKPEGDGAFEITCCRQQPRSPRQPDRHCRRPAAHRPVLPAAGTAFRRLRRSSSALPPLQP